jgi:flagellar hook-length control protein FliK
LSLAEPTQATVPTQSAPVAEPSPIDAAVAAPPAEGVLADVPTEQPPVRDDGAQQAAAEPLTFDDMLAADRRFERLAVQRHEPRTSGASEPPQIVAAPHYQAAAVAASSAEAGTVAKAAVRQHELQRIVLPTANAATDSSGPAELSWLPPGGTVGGPVGNGAHTSAAAPQTVPGTPVDTCSPTWDEAFASRVQWLVDHDVGEAHIKLNPPELGAVDVKISLVEDKTFVHLTTATAAARDELSQTLPRLRELFSASGLELGGASVQGGRDGQQTTHGHGDRSGGSAAGTHLPAPFAGPDELPPGLPRPSLGRIDIFA